MRHPTSDIPFKDKIVINFDNLLILYVQDATKINNELPYIHSNLAKFLSILKLLNIILKQF